VRVRVQAVPEAPLSLARRLAQQFQGEVIRSPAASPGSFVAQLAAVAETENQVSSLGDTKSSLGDANISLGDAESSLGVV
jgi:hypothetical protein